jgi:hypothetical protein
MMTTPEYNFAGRDFSAEKERLIQLLIAWIVEYTDLNESDAGIFVLEMLNRETDELNFYLNQVFREGFKDTARFRQSLIMIGRTVDYLPVIASAASTRFRLDRKPGVTGPIAVPRYSEFQRRDGLGYLTVAPVTLQPGIESLEVDAIQGILITRDMEPSEFRIIDKSKHPRANLGVSVAAGTCEMWTGSEVVSSWTEVDSFWRSRQTDRHFLLELNGNTDEVWLVLGDGVKGQATPTEALHVRFVRTAEAAGNCGHSIITIVPDGFDDLITATNIEPATGGAPSESTESIRRSIEPVTHAQRRGVNTGDYVALLEHLPGVLHVQALDRNNAPGPLNVQMFGSTACGWPHEYVVIVVVPEGGGPMSSLMKNQIWDQLTSWGCRGGWRGRYILVDAISQPVNVAMRIGVSEGSVSDVVRSAAIAAIQGVLTPEHRSIGEAQNAAHAGRIGFSEFHMAASAVAGVSWVEFDAPDGDIPVPDGCIATPGTITATIQ